MGAEKKIFNPYNLIPAFEEWLQFIESFDPSRQIKPANWDK